MLPSELESAALQDGFFNLFQSVPLDDVLDALEEALEQKAAYLGNNEDALAFRALRSEIRDLRNRDFASSDEDETTQVQ